MIDLCKDHSYLMLPRCDMQPCTLFLLRNSHIKMMEAWEIKITHTSGKTVIRKAGQEFDPIVFKFEA